MSAKLNHTHHITLFFLTARIQTEFNPLTPALFVFFYIQFITIFAFATVAGFVGSFQFDVNCEVPGKLSSRVVKGKFYYPFNSITLYTAADGQFCANETEPSKESTLDMNYKSEAQYFVFTGVVSMLFVLVALVYYVLFEDRAKEATSTDVGLFSFPVVVRFLLFLVANHCLLTTTVLVIISTLAS